MSDERFKDIFRRIVSDTPEAPSFSDLEMHRASPTLPSIFKPWMAVAGAAALVLVVVGAVGLLASGPGDVAPPLGNTTILSDDWIIPGDCPVTIPSGNFTPPDTHAAAPADSGSVWHGTDDLWTSLPVSGKYLPRKSVWWSANFPGGGVEEVPDIRVEYRLLNIARDLVIPLTDGTNAYTAADGDFIIAGFDPNVTGCWEVTAFYKDASLTYVYYNPRGDDPSEIGYVPEVAGLTIAEAEELLSLRFYHSVFDSGNLEYIVCSQEPIRGTELAPGEIVHMRTASPDQLCDEIFGDPTPPVAICTDAEPGPGKFVVYFDCGSGEYPNPTAVVRELPPVTSGATSFAIGTAFEQLLAGPSEKEIGSGFGSFFNEASADALISAKFEAGHLTLDVTEAIFVNNASTSTGSLFYLAELNANAFAFADVDSVDYLVNGDCAAIWVFVQAGPECHTVTRAEWEATQAEWENG